SGSEHLHPSGVAGAGLGFAVPAALDGLGSAGDLCQDRLVGPPVPLAVRVVGVHALGQDALPVLVHVLAAGHYRSDCPESTARTPASYMAGSRFFRTLAARVAIAWLRRLRVFL